MNDDPPQIVAIDGEPVSCLAFLLRAKWFFAFTPNLHEATAEIYFCCGTKITLAEEVNMGGNWIETQTYIVYYAREKFYRHLLNECANANNTDEAILTFWRAFGLMQEGLTR